MKYIDIDLTQSKIRVPNKVIGKQGESFATGIRFKLQPEYSGWGVFVDIETPNGEKGRVELADVRDNVAIYEVSGEELEYNGRLKLDLVLSNETSISKPFSGEFTIKRAICAENPQEGEIPIILTSDMVARIEKIEKDAERLNYNIVGRLSESEDGQLMFDGAPIGKDVEREIYAEDIKYENPQIAEDSDNLKEAIDELANYIITSVEIMDGSISALFDESHSHTFDEKVLNRFSDKSGILYYSGSPVGSGNSKDIDVSVKSNTETEYILTFRVGDKIFDTPNLIGSDGTIGEDGVGISSVALNEDYTLTITLDNGESFTTSSIRGEKGEKGDNYVLTDADKEEIISDLIEKIPQNNVSAEDVAYTTEYMPTATNVKEALDATGEGFVSITQDINDIHENFMRTADAEQKIEDALASAKASGEFKGEKGESVAVRNINHSTEDGGENIVYFTDGNVLSVKNGNTGANGKNGVTFTPIVSDDGTLSWTNDGELENPAEINIKGEAGKSGVYIGDGDMPDGCNVKINPNGGVIRVPTKLSELDNDKGFITKADIPTNGTSDCINPYFEGTDVTAETEDEQRVIDAYQNMMSECMGDSEKIPFLLQTDNHNYFPKGIYNLCAKMINFAQFSQVLTLGDIAGNYFHETHLQNFVDAMKVFPIEKKTAIAGNHDVWVGASDRSYIDQSKLSKYLKNYTLRRYGTNGYGVLIDDYFNMKYLIISNYDKDKGEGGSRISTKQVNFIIDELSKKDGYDVVILSHEPISLGDSTTTALLEAGIYTTMGNYFSFISSRNGFTSMLLARKNKGSGTYTDDEGVEHTYDFTECNSDLLCCFCGHTHVEGFDFINGELLNVAWGGINHADGHPIYFGYIDKKNRLLKYYRVAGDYSSSVTVGLDKVSATNMALDKTEIAMNVGELAVIAPIFTPITAGNQRIVWTSSNNDVATVKKGFVLGIAEGTATITAVSEDGSFTATCLVTVGTPEEPEEPDIPDEPDVPSGGEDSEGNLPNDNFTAYAEPYTWTTGYPNAAGTIIDNEYSTERVTAEFLPITVGSEVCLGNTDALFDTKWIAVAFYTENQKCIERQVSTTYKDENGKYVVFTAPKGSAYMKVSATMSAVETAVIYINQIAVEPESVLVESVTLNETAIVKVGKTKTLSATVNPDNATEKTLNWYSNNETVATVDQNGVVTGVTVGDATITCSATDGSGVSASCLVTVEETASSNLPAEYQEVEYLYTNDRDMAHIPTVTSFAVGDKGYITAEYTGLSGQDTAICGTQSFAEIYVTGSGKQFKHWSKVTLVNPTDGTPAEENKVYNVEFDFTGAVSNLVLMAYNTDGKYGMHGKFYSASFYRGDMLIYNFVPCYRIADGKIGMYDTVNNVFAEGAGELFKGADV